MRASLLAIVASLLVSTSAFAASVWVSPFVEADDQQQPDWVTRSLHQSLVDELATLKSVNVQMSKEPVDAQYIVRATVQRVEGELRVTGHVEDKTGKNVGGFKSTGRQRDLFAIQDQIATQVARIVAPDEQLTTTEPVEAKKDDKLIELETPFIPGGGFIGSDLERAVHTGYAQPRVVYRNVYPEIPNFNWGFYRHRYPGYATYPTYGYGYPYGYGYGSGYGFGGGNQFIFVNSGFGHHGGHHVGHHGSVVGVPNLNGQAIRHRASWAGNPPPTMVHSPGPAGSPQLVPGGTPAR